MVISLVRGASTLCKTAFAGWAMQTRRKYIPVGSRLPSLATDGLPDPTGKDCQNVLKLLQGNPALVSDGKLFMQKELLLCRSHSVFAGICDELAGGAWVLPLADRRLPGPENAPAFPALPPSLAVG